MFWAVVLFIVGLVLLIKGGDWFVEGATGIAERLHIPEILIGATVVSIGTTIPEVMVSAASAVSGHGEMAYGNAIGSVICNTSLIAAITVAFRPGKIEKKSLRMPIIFFFIAAVFYAVTAYLFGTFDRWVGIVLLIMFAAYITVCIRQARKEMAAVPGAEKKAEEAKKELPDKEKLFGLILMPAMLKDLILLAVGAALIAVGANLLVDNGTIIAVGLGVPESVVALTMVALGTSLPELITAITSLMKGHSDLSLGNVIGANLFNLVLVSGVSVTLSPFEVPVSHQIAGLNTSLVVDFPVMFAVMLILTVPALIKGKLSRWQGILLLCIYAGFTVFQFIK